MIDKLTIFFPYYNQPTALINQLEIMSNYNEEIRKKYQYSLLMTDQQKRNVN